MRQLRDGAKWKNVRNHIKRTGDAIGPFKNICWAVVTVIGVFVMGLSFINDSFFYVLVCAVGGQLLWAAASFVRAFKQPQTNNTQDRSSDAEEIKRLVGSWTVRKNTPCEPRYLAVWIFSEDNQVVSDREGDHATGRWCVEPTRMLIQWDRPLSSGEQCYDTFHRPINPSGVQGDSWGGWDGLSKVRATKAPSIDGSDKSATFN